VGQKWGKKIFWGNHKLTHGVIKPSGSAWKLDHGLGRERRVKATTSCGARAARPRECDNIVWGTSDRRRQHRVGHRRPAKCDNIVWGTDARRVRQHRLGHAAATMRQHRLGHECGDADCDNIVWGASVDENELDNIVWGTQTRMRQHRVGHQR
jgi:hypothetical protein